MGLEVHGPPAPSIALAKGSRTVIDLSRRVFEPNSAFLDVIFRAYPLCTPSKSHCPATALRANEHIDPRPQDEDARILASRSETSRRSVAETLRVQTVCPTGGRLWGSSIVPRAYSVGSAPRRTHCRARQHYDTPST